MSGSRWKSRTPGKGEIEYPTDQTQCFRWLRSWVRIDSRPDSTCWVETGGQASQDIRIRQKYYIILTYIIPVFNTTQAHIIISFLIDLLHPGPISHHPFSLALMRCGPGAPWIPNKWRRPCFLYTPNCMIIWRKMISSIWRDYQSEHFIRELDL